MRKLRQKLRSRPDLGGEAGDGHSLTWPRDPGYGSYAGVEASLLPPGQVNSRALPRPSPGFQACT